MQYTYATPTSTSPSCPVGTAMARGALRAALDRSIKDCEAFRIDFMRNGCRPPDTFKNFEPWVKRQVARVAATSVLIRWGKLGRRRGFFSTTCVFFFKDGDDSPLRLGFSRMRLTVEPRTMCSIETGSLPLAIDAHAVARIFQRRRTLAWSDIRDCLAPAAAHAEILFDCYRKVGCRQCAIALEHGLLIGDIEGDLMVMRTFLLADLLTGRRLRLYQDLLRWVRASAVLNAPCRESLEAILTTETHAWLGETYVPGVSWSDIAWAKHIADGANQEPSTGAGTALAPSAAEPS